MTKAIRSFIVTMLAALVVTVTGAKINSDGHLIIKMSNGKSIDAGYVRGEDGKDGVGIDDMYLNDDGELIVELTDDASKNLGNFAENIVADNGKSAYDIAVEQGFVGDKDAWLASLKGKDGTDGIGITNVEIVNGDLIITYSDGSTQNAGKVTSDVGGVVPADEGTEGLWYIPLEDGTYGVNIGNAALLNEIIVPEYHNGKPVTRVIRFGESFIEPYLRNASITIFLPKTIELISKGDFEGFGDEWYSHEDMHREVINNITIVFPKDSQLKKIENYAFCGTPTLVNLPENVEIEPNAFY